MSKQTQSGSFLAKHFPTLFKHFSENASQEDFNKAEQEAAVVFQQHQSNGKPQTQERTVDAAVSALLPKSHPAILAALTAGDLTAFAAEMQELQNRLSAQTQGNTAVSADLTKAQAELTKVQGELTTANTRLTELTPKAAAWDAHQAALGNANVVNDTTNGKTKPAGDLTAKDQAHVEKLTELKAKYPSLMADIDVPAPKE